MADKQAIEKIKKEAINKFGYSADTTTLMEFVFAGMDEAGYQLPTDKRDREAVAEILTDWKVSICKMVHNNNETLAEAPINIADYILSLRPELKVLNDEEIKMVLAEYHNWCEEQLLPDSPDDRNIYTMENIYSRIDAREIELVKRTAQAQLGLKEGK